MGLTSTEKSDRGLVSSDTVRPRLAAPFGFGSAPLRTPKARQARFGEPQPATLRVTVIWMYLFAFETVPAAREGNGRRYQTFPFGEGGTACRDG